MKTSLCKSGFLPPGWNLSKNLCLALLGFAIALFPGCDKSPQSSSPGKLVIKGSNTVGEELAPRLVADYKKDHPDALFEMEFKATSYGLATLLAGQCDIAAASRTLVKGELDLAQSRQVELKDYIIGYYSVALIANAACPVANLTKDQVRDIFTGVIKNWKEAGGPDAPIHLYVRDPVSGTYLGFRELAMENNPYASGLTTLTNYTGIVQAVAQDANGIGYAPISLVANSGVKAVSVAGISPTAETVRQGQYPYARVLRLYTNKANEPAAVADFIKFVQSSRGQEIVAQMGYVPKP
jgi:phosphate transport system substrate-binding protein